MKNINYKTRFAFAALLTVGIVSSCKDYLHINPITSVGPDVVFGSVDNARLALLGAYSPLEGDQTYGIRVSMYYAYDADDLMGQGGGGSDNERRDIAHYNVQPGNTQLAAPFNQLYLGIERANVCIYYIPKMAAYASGSPEDQAELKRFHGEALTLRAQYYSELIRNWGDVPVQYLPSSFESDLFKAQNDRKATYDHLLADLADASALVPWKSKSSTSNTDERITQGFVRGLRARIALAAGGYSLHNGVMTRTSDYKAYYQIAKDETLAIMQSNEHHLNPSFQSIFKDGITAHAMEPAGEMLFQVGMTGGNSAAGDSKLAYYNGPTSNGNGNGALTILPTYFYAFDAHDSRRDVTCAPYNFASGLYAPRSLATMVDGKFRRDWITNPVPVASSIQQYFGLSWPMMRYADVLLMYAEADNEINNGPSSAAIAALEQVRARAFGTFPIGTTPTSYSAFFDYLVKERLFEFGGEGIRKYDLLRWNLLGTKIAETKTNLAAIAIGGPYPPNPAINIPTTMYATLNQPITPVTTTPWTGVSWKTDFYSPAPPSPPANSTSVTWAGSTITTTIIAIYAVGFTPGKSELLPFATSELDANPNLAQNFGF